MPHLVSTDAVTALRQLCEQYPEQVVFTTSLGLEDQALTDLIAQHMFQSSRKHQFSGAAVP